jgi:protein TonB
MKPGSLLFTLLAIVVAAVLHAGFLLFGGLLIPDAKEDRGTLQDVDLLVDEGTTGDAKKDGPEPERTVTEVMETEQEAPPDAEEVIRSIEVSAEAAAPALEAASLSAIEQALSGGSGPGGDFAEALTFASGGRIGGTGKPGTVEEGIEKAFSLTEIDQKPRAIFQSAPLYPSEMRGKKVEGVVTVIFVVDPSGKVSAPRVEQSTHAAFEKPALEAIRQWKFEPAVKGGARVPCKMRIPIRFQPS